MSKIKPDSDLDNSSSNFSQRSDEGVETGQYREKYSAERLMMMLDKQRLRALKKEFKDHNDGIELPNFVWLMKCALNVEESEEIDLVLGLYYLFQEVDINGDEHMEWSEFTQYIIDTVLSQQSRERFGNKELMPAEILDLAYSLKHIRFQASLSYDRNMHTGYIKYLNYYSSLDLVGFFESGSKCLRFVDHNLEVKYQVVLEIGNEAFVVAAAYAEMETLLVVVSSDKRFHRYEKDKDGFRKLDGRGASFQCSKSIEQLWYFEKQRVWIAACKDNNLRYYIMRDPEVLMTYKGHTQKIMDVVEIWKPLCIASSSMDAYILLWNLRDGSKLGSINTSQYKGVRSMDYCPDYGGNLLTIGFDREIRIWNPESNLLKCYTGKLEGHAKAVICCKFFRGKGICISLDEEGNIRVWDIRQQVCLQIISNEKMSIDVNKLVVLPKHEKFLISGKRLMTFELIHNSASQEKLFEIKPVEVEFNSYYMQFVIMTRFDVRIYDGVSGKLKKVFTKFQGIEETELSAMCLDKRNRVLIVGDSLGSLRTYNFCNGSLIRTVRDQTDKNVKLPSVSGNDCSDYSEISCFFNCVEDNILIAATWDSSLMFFSTKNISEITLLRHLQGGHNESDITCLAYSPYLSFVVSGSSNGILALWDFEKGNLERAFFVHQHKITVLMFLDPYPILLSTSKDGVNCLWHLSREKIQEDRLGCYVFRMDSGMNEGTEKVFVTACYNLPEQANPLPQDPNSIPKTPKLPTTQVYIGTSTGQLKLWDFSTFYRKAKISPNQLQERFRPDYNPHRKDKKNASSDLAYWKKKGTQSLNLLNLNLEPKLLKHEWNAHHDQVTCIKYINEPTCIFTCSLDRYLKVWSLSGELLGIIHLAVPELPKKWSFPFTWEKRRQQDLDQVSELLKVIDNEIQIKPSGSPKKNTPKPTENPKKRKKPKKKPFENFAFNQPETPKYQFWYETSSEEEIHKEEKKDDPILKEERVCDLRWKLEDIDEKNGREVAKGLREFRPPFKQKTTKDDEFERGKIRKLPQIVQKMEKKNTIKNLQKSEGANRKQSEMMGATMRPMFGSCNYLMKQSGKVLSPSFRPSLVEISDMKFAKGESERLIQKAISNESLARNSMIMPFTEDLSTLKSVSKEFSLIRSTFQSPVLRK